MPRFIVPDDNDEDYTESGNMKNLSGISSDSNDVLETSSDNDWLKQAATKKGLKLSRRSDSSILYNSPTEYQDSMFPKDYPDPNTINTDFEWPKISAMEKGFEVLNRKFPGSINISPKFLNSTMLNNKTISFLGKNGNDDLKTQDNENDLNSINKDISRERLVFSKKKLLLENELLMRENVKKEVEKRKEDMENFSQNLKHQTAMIRAILAQQRQEEEQEKARFLKAEEELMNEKIEQNEIRRKRERQLEKQRIQEKMKKIEQEQAQFAQTVREKAELLERVQLYPMSFQTKCNDINTLATSCKDRNSAIAILTPHYQRLKELSQQMDMIKEKTQSGNITTEDERLAEDILRNLDEVIKQYSAETERIDQAFDAELAHREYEYKRAELQLQAASQGNVPLQAQIAVDRTDGFPQSSVEAAVPIVPQSQPETIQVAGEDAGEDDLQCQVNLELWRLYTQSRAILEQFEITHKDFLHNESLKAFRFECQKAIISPVNAINAISKEHLTDKYNRVTSVLTGKSSLNLSLHPQSLSFCMNTLAKKIVTQGVQLVSSIPKMAFGFASFTVAIWNDFPDFGTMLLAHFRTSSPYVIPVWLPQLEPEVSDTNDYKNLKKHSGILRLYASIIVSRPRKNVNKSHPHGLGNAWKWLAATLNTEPKSDTTELMATLILDMLEVTGHFLLNAYPKQTRKLLNVLRNNYFPMLKNLTTDASGPVSRLEEFLEKTVSSGSIPPPTGILPPDYW